MESLTAELYGHSRYQYRYREPMVTFDDVAEYAESLPLVELGTSYGRRGWKVAKKGFVWERPFTKADIRRWGDSPIPEGPILGVMTEDLDEKAALLDAHPTFCFTIEHLDNYPAVLVQLVAIDLDQLHTMIVDAWTVVAPAPTVGEFLGQADG